MPLSVRIFTSSTKGRTSKATNGEAISPPRQATDDLAGQVEAFLADVKPGEVVAISHSAANETDPDGTDSLVFSAMVVVDWE